MFNLFSSLISAASCVFLVIFSLQAWPRLFLPRLVLPLESQMLFLIRTGLGAIIFSYILFILATFHLLSSFPLRVLMALACMGTLYELFLLLPALKAHQFKWNSRILLLVVYFLSVAVLALLPAAEKDEIIYHLEIPRQMLAQQGWAYLSDNIYNFFPQFTELFFAFGLNVSGKVAARLFHSAFGLLLVLTLYVYARRYLNQFWASVSAGIFMIIPSVMLLMSWAYVDLAFSWFALLAWIAGEQILKAEEKKWAILTGCFCGAAACIKYTGIQYTLLLSVLIFLQGVRQRRSAYVAGRISILFVFAGLIFTPYLIRNYLATGWPLYPFHVEGFSLKDGWNWDIHLADLYLMWIKTFGAPMGENSMWLGLTAPLRVFWDGAFNDPAKFEGVIGPIFLLLPILYLFRKMKAAPVGPALFGLLFIYYWTQTTQQVRFLIPMLPFACLLLAYGLSQLKKPVAYVLLGISFLFSLNVIFQEVSKKQPWNYLLGKETRENYLARQHEVYPMYSATNRLLPPNAKVYLLQMKNYGYYLEHSWTADFLFERYQLENFLKTHPGATQVGEFFKKTGAHYLLVDYASLRSSQSGIEPELLIPFDQFISGSAKMIAVKKDVALYKLTSPPASV